MEVCYGLRQLRATESPEMSEVLRELRNVRKNSRRHLSKNLQRAKFNQPVKKVC